MKKIVFRIPLWMGLLNWAVSILLTGLIMPLFKGQIFEYRDHQSIDRYFENAAAVAFFSTLFTVLPLLLVLLTIGILNRRNLKKGTYALLLVGIQMLMALLTYILIQGEFRNMDEVFIAGLLISIVSFLTWVVLFLIRKPEQTGGFKSEKLLDEDMEHV